MVKSKLAIVVPCYNEEEVLPETIFRLSNILKKLCDKEKISKESFILFVDDGSEDKTWEIIKTFYEKNNFIKGLKLSRNFGHQYALMAGIEYVSDKCDCMISIDADLQQDVTKIEEFIDKFSSGKDVIYGVRNDRRTDNVFKKTTALAFYKIMKLMGVKIIKNHADYRLLSKKAIRALLQFQESNLF
ncbi:MAG: glycosyltransferase family 2 protein, partial [Bacteroidales bacterium]|nr:glycosyltransferase family 2 protein [Bacteroidales bacterium]